MMSLWDALRMNMMISYQELVRTFLSKNHIDIVLSDVNMPNMDGYRLTQRIRQLGLTLPVIGVTANALAEEKQRCLESGMDSCLSKPVTLDVIKQTLTLYAERVRKSRDS
ncbi:response regulator, partial [Escherichia coli]